MISGKASGSSVSARGGAEDGLTQRALARHRHHSKHGRRSTSSARPGMAPTTSSSCSRIRSDTTVHRRGCSAPIRHAQSTRSCSTRTSSIIYCTSTVHESASCERSSRRASVPDADRAGPAWMVGTARGTTGRCVLPECRPSRPTYSANVVVPSSRGSSGQSGRHRLPARFPCDPDLTCWFG